MANSNSWYREIRHKLQFHHQDNKNRGVYGYMWWTSLKIAALYFIIVIPIVLLCKHFIDFDKIFGYITENLSDGYVLVVFFLSESFLGLIPPDIFMIWATKFSSPLLILTSLGILSYAGGAISCQIGYLLSIRPKIKAYTERRLDKYIVLTRKWGAAFIVIAALFPFSPLSLVAIALGLLKYPIKSYLFFGISRIVRFLVQGLLYAGLFHLDAILKLFSRTFG